jgi:conjugative relaxase-like TrwC/TraI family protein
MLSIGRVGRGNSAKAYYLQLHEEDYYNRKGGSEPPGQWEGRLPAAFGLRGLVDEKEFCKLFNAESPTGEVFRQRRPNERPAFDLTFSAPKSVSIVHALADPETKRAIEAVMYGAVKEAFGYIEDEACLTRREQGGAEVVRGEGLAAALFLHNISRELDLQLHIHAVTFNFTKGPDGKYRTLDGSKLYEHKHAAGALFRAKLATRLMALGLEIERDRFSFSLNGVPPDLSEEFSKRVEQIRRELGEEEATPKQKDGAALRSREPKRDVDHDELLAEWREVAKAHGFTAERVSELRDCAPITFTN